MFLCRKANISLKAEFGIQKLFSSFSAAMSEALDARIAKEEANAKKVPYKARYNGRMKKRQWQSDDRTDAEIAEKRANFDPADRIKRKKSLILMGYSGVNYVGMQRNPGQKTIEEDLFAAMLKNNWIDEEGYKQAQWVQFQRAARTDKGVSAARQVCSIKLPDAVDVAALNSSLPDQIRIFAIKRVTKGFNAKDQCDARTYAYTLPTVAFAAFADEVDILTYRTSADKVEEFNKLLEMYEGTKNFHNFTCRKEFLDPSSKRYIISFKCAEPFVGPDNVEYATIKIKGQSFMMHQIRKMVGLTLAVIRGHTTSETITRAMGAERIDIPMAPGLGLVLDQVHYDRYNRRYGEDGIHETLTFEKENEEIEEFVKKFIYPSIFETELKTGSMVGWLETLKLHTYDVRTEDSNKNKDETQTPPSNSKDDNEE